MWNKELLDMMNDNIPIAQIGKSMRLNQDLLHSLQLRVKENNERKELIN